MGNRNKVVGSRTSKWFVEHLNRMSFGIQFENDHSKWQNTSVFVECRQACFKIE